MLETTKAAKEELAIARLERNLPFFYQAFQIVLPLENLQSIAERISRNFAFPTTDGTLAIILGAHSPHHLSFSDQWDAYVTYCIRGMANFYIPFMDDEVADVVYQGAPTSYVRIHRSKVYPSGRLIKRIIPQDIVDQIKEKQNASS